MDWLQTTESFEAFTKSFHIFITHIIPYIIIRDRWLPFSSFSPLEPHISPPFYPRASLYSWNYDFNLTLEKKCWLYELSSMSLSLLQRLLLDLQVYLNQIWNHDPSLLIIFIKLQTHRIGPLYQLWFQASFPHPYLIPSKLWISLWNVPYLLFRLMIFLFPFGESSRSLAPVVCSGGIFDSIFSYLSSIRDKKAYLARMKLFFGFLFKIKFIKVRVFLD